MAPILRRILYFPKILNLLATLLSTGEKQFILGDEQCEHDCAIFGQLAQAVWQSPGSQIESLIDSKYLNLKEYCVRMKEKYWPEWEDRVMDSI